MTNQITLSSSTLCPNKAYEAKHVILEPVAFQPAIYDYKIHKYNKITIYIRLALQTIKTSMYTGTIGFEGSVFVPCQCNSCFAPLLVIYSTWYPWEQAAKTLTASINLEMTANDCLQNMCFKIRWHLSSDLFLNTIKCIIHVLKFYCGCWKAVWSQHNN